MAFPRFAGYGVYSGQMPALSMATGQPVPGAAPNMPYGAYSEYSTHSATYSAAADPVRTYFSAMAGQISSTEETTCNRSL